MPLPNIAVDVQHLTRHYPSRARNTPPVVANDDLSFHVLRGECFGLLGPNGAGKTTLISQLLGILAPTSGQIWVGGVDMVRAPQHGKQLIGYLPQHGLAMRSVEVERALRYTGRLRGQSEADARAQVREILEELELAPYASRSVNQLAGGMARLAYFAMALMGRPPILILDEPTNELDPQKRKLIWDVLARRNREQGTTCILVTHNVLEAEKVLQRVGVMQHGRMIAVGTPGELKQRASGAGAPGVLAQGRHMLHRQRAWPDHQAGHAGAAPARPLPRLPRASANRARNRPGDEPDWAGATRRFPPDTTIA